MTDTLPTATSKALAAVEGGAIAFGEFLRTVARRDPADTTPAVDLPKAVVVSAEQAAAIATLADVLATAVTPTERRTLTADEVVSLMGERAVLDAVAKVIDGRKDAQKAAIFNHLDVELEAAGATGDADRDAKGHYAVKGEVAVPEAGKKFARELRTGSPTLDADALAALVDDPSIDFSHDDYLACTTQVRVLDEAKVLLHIRKRPEVVAALGRATKAGSVTASLNVRKL